VQVLFQDGTRVHTSRKLYIHQDYLARNFKNDIALIKFPKLKRFTRNQQAICLPHGVNTTNIIKHGNKMYAVGWGATKPLKPGEYAEEADMSKHLKQVKLPFKANTFCDKNVKEKIAKESRRKKNIWYFNSTTQFCAGDITGQKDTCQGDSCGPAMALNLHPVSGKWRWFQVGIISWGDGCSQKGEVGYYTKVSAYLNWINTIIRS
jgi:secreted trypsin-like serine protease